MNTIKIKTLVFIFSLILTFNIKAETNDTTVQYLVLNNVAYADLESTLKTNGSRGWVLVSCTPKSSASYEHTIPLTLSNSRAYLNPDCGDNRSVTDHYPAPTISYILIFKKLPINIKDNQHENPNYFPYLIIVIILLTVIALILAFKRQN